MMLRKWFGIEGGVLALTLISACSGVAVDPDSADFAGRSEGGGDALQLGATAQSLESSGSNSVGSFFDPGLAVLQPQDIDRLREPLLSLNERVTLLRSRALQLGGKVRVIGQIAANTFEAVAALPSAAAAAPGLARLPELLQVQDRLVLRARALGVSDAVAIARLPLVVFEVTPDQLDALVANGEFESVYEDVPVPATLTNSGPLVHAPQAQTAGARGAGQTVAILDTGVQSSHPFLTGRVVEEACFSTTSAVSRSTSVCPGGASSSTATGSGAPCTTTGCDHGTHVAGIAAGRGTASISFSGMAPDADIMAVQVFSRFTDATGNTPCANAGTTSPCVLSFTSDQIRGLQRVLDRAAARTIASVNMSLGGGLNASACDSDARKPVIDSLLSAGVATVIAAGNSGSSTGVGAPGCVSTAVTVGSTTLADAISSFSNMAALVDILAPGSSITSSVTGSAFGTMSGTSMAAPHVAGAFAALRSRVPNRSVNEILAALQNSGVPVTDPRNSITRSRIDIEGALGRLLPQSFALTPGMLFQVHTSGRIFAHNGVACSGESCPGWVMLDNNPSTTAIAAAGTNLYQLHSDGKIWRYTGTACGGTACPGWVMLDNNPATAIITAGGSSLYQMHSDGKIWRHTGVACTGNSCPGWVMLDTNPATQSILAEGTRLYQLHNNGKIWRHTGVACTGNSCPGWVMLDTNPATTAIAAAGGNLYQLHNNGKIWRHTGVACTGNSCPGWAMLDTNPATSAIAAGGAALYQLHNNGRIWRHTGVVCIGNLCPGWVMLDNNPAGIQIVASTAGLFQRHGDGSIWRSTGVTCTGESCPGWTRLDNNPSTESLTAAAP